jgi:hypothetical protein
MGDGRPVKTKKMLNVSSEKKIKNFPLLGV